ASADWVRVRRSSDLARSLCRAVARARRGSAAVRPAWSAPACASPAFVCLGGGLKLLDPTLARRGAPSCRGGYLHEGNLRCAVGVEQSVGFLIGVGKLRVAETSEQRKVENDLEQLVVDAAEFFRGRAQGVSP